MQDYIELLNAKGYEAYPFDISCLKDNTYTMTFEVKEYVGGQDSEISSKRYSSRKNRIMVSDFMWRELSTEELEDIKRNSCDYENGVYSRSQMQESQRESTEILKDTPHYYVIGVTLTEVE